MDLNVWELKCYTYFAFGPAWLSGQPLAVQDNFNKRMKDAFPDIASKWKRNIAHSIYLAWFLDAETFRLIVYIVEWSSSLNSVARA